MAEGKFYWLKLKRDFFKRHDITIIEAMPGGKDYILFYLKLLCESVDHDGSLRFNDEIPYSEEMLSTITNTDISIVKSAIGLFLKLNMMELMDDGTYFMREVDKMIGCAADNDNANRQRRYREKQKQLVLQECYGSVTKNNESKSIEIEKDKEIDIKEISNDKEKARSSRFSKPSVEEIQAYCLERNNGIDANEFYDFYEAKGWKIGKEPMKNWQATVRTWERRRKIDIPIVNEEPIEKDYGGFEIVDTKTSETPYEVANTIKTLHLTDKQLEQWLSSYSQEFAEEVKKYLEK